MIDQVTQRRGVFPHPLLGMLDMGLDLRRQRRAGRQCPQGVAVHHSGRARLSHEIEQRAFLQQYDQMRGIQRERPLQRIELRFRTFSARSAAARLSQKLQVSRRDDNGLLEQRAGRRGVARRQEPACALMQLIRVAPRFCWHHGQSIALQLQRMPAPKIVNMFAVPFAFGRILDTCSLTQL